MKRSELVENLIKEGMSEKTLVNFTDKQLSRLHERMVISADKLKSDPKLQAIANDPNTEVEVKEELKGGQKKLDKNKNGKIDGEDFKLLKGQKNKKCEHCDKEMSKCSCDDSHLGESKEKKNELPKVGKKVTKGHNNIPEFMDSKKLKKEGVETKKWVESLAEEKFFHILTSKNEIMEMIQTKLNDQKSEEKTELPDFLKWASLKSVKGKKEVAEGGTTTKPAPTKPKVDPGTKPKHPLSPGKFPKQVPKALAEKK
jgi:hypothetical protein